MTTDTHIDYTSCTDEIGSVKDSFEECKTDLKNHDKILRTHDKVLKILYSRIEENENQIAQLKKQHNNLSTTLWVLLSIVMGVCGVLFYLILNS